MAGKCCVLRRCDGCRVIVEKSLFSLSIAALCIGLLCYAASSYGSHTKAAKLLLFNSGLLAVMFVILRLILTEWCFSGACGPWLHRIFRMSWITESSAIMLALIAVGLVVIEAAGKIAGDVTRKRFQSSIIAAATVLVLVNIVHFLRPVSCYDCFFPYGLPFTLFMEGGYGGGRVFVWTGIVADAALVPALAAISTLLWNHICVVGKNPYSLKIPVRGLTSVILKVPLMLG
jgi:hypothetical protein